MVFSYLIYLQNLSQKVKILQNHYYVEDFSYLQHSKSFELSPISYYTVESSVNIAKRLSFREASNNNDNFYFNNEYNWKHINLNKEIMGITPRKEIAKENIIPNMSNKGIVEINLSKDNNFDYANFYENEVIQSTHTNDYVLKEKLPKYNEKPRISQSFSNKENLFFNYPNISFEQKMKNMKYNNNNKERISFPKNSFSSDKENYNLNYSLQNCDSIIRRK